jgi:hypothetical protein
METLFAEIIKGLFNLVYDAIQHLCLQHLSDSELLKLENGNLN